MLPIEDFIRKLIYISLDTISGFEKKSILNIKVLRISFVFGRYLIDALDNDNKRIVICFFEQEYNRGVIHTWGDVFMRNHTTFEDCDNFMVGFLVSKFKYKNTKSFQIKLSHCVRYTDGDLTVFERCLLKVSQ